MGSINGCCANEQGRVVPENAIKYFATLEAVAGTSACAAAGVVALTTELVKAGIIPSDAGQRVADAMVRSMERNTARASRQAIADAIETGFAHMAVAAE
jgi:polyhydroxyalkanoate synthesis regulator phasin